jgi:hypothetical protein
VSASDAGSPQGEGISHSFVPGQDDLTPDIVVGRGGTIDAHLVLVTRFTLEAPGASHAMDFVGTTQDLLRLGPAVSLDRLEPRAQTPSHGTPRMITCRPGVLNGRTLTPQVGA